MNKCKPILFLLLVICLCTHLNYAQDITVTKTYLGGRVHNMVISPPLSCTDAKNNEVEILPVLVQETGLLAFSKFGLIGTNLPKPTPQGGELNLHVYNDGVYEVISLTSNTGYLSGNWSFSSDDAILGFDTLFYAELIDYATLQVTTINIPAKMRTYVKKAYMLGLIKSSPSYEFMQTKDATGKPIVTAKKDLQIAAGGKVFTISPIVSIENILPQVVGVNINYENDFSTRCVQPHLIIKFDDGTVIKREADEGTCKSEKILFNEALIKKINTSFISAITFYNQQDGTNYTAELKDTSAGYFVELYAVANKALPSVYINKKVSRKGNFTFAVSRSLNLSTDTANKIQLVPVIGSKDNKPYLKSLNVFYNLNSSPCAENPSVILQLADNKVVYPETNSTGGCSGVLSFKIKPEDLPLLEKNKITKVIFEDEENRLKLTPRNINQSYFIDLLESIRKN